MDETVLPAYSPGSVARLCGRSGSLTDGGGRKLATCSCGGPRARFLFVPSTGIIKNDLFNINSRRRRRGRPASANDDPDGFTRNFGSAVPQNIPESRRLFIRVARLSRSWRGGTTDVHIRLTLKNRCQCVVAHASQGPVRSYRGGRYGYSAGRGVGARPWG